MDRKLISPELRVRSTNLPDSAEDLVDIQNDFADAYAGNEPDFKDALLAARDYLGRLLALTWGSLSPNFLTYHEVLRGLMRADGELTGGLNHSILRECFAWREIGPGPTSVLLRPHTLQDCGLRSAPSADLGTRAVF